jgi:hypothetical protein
MITLELTAWERLQLSGWAAGNVRGDLDVQRHGMRLLDVLELSEEEKEAAGWHEIRHPRCPMCRREGGIEIALENPETVFVLSFEDGDAALLRPAIAWDWPLDRQGRVLALLEKLRTANG